MDILKMFKREEKKKSVYMDYASATPVLPEVFSAMVPYFSRSFSNPASLYESGVKAKEAILESKHTIAKILGCSSSEIIFTANGTEANNLAFFGLVNSDGRFDGKHFVTMKTEHSSIKEIVNEIQKRGGEVSFADVKEDGSIDIKSLSSAIKENTVMVSVMMVNNEIGTIQPIKEISSVVRKARKKFGTNIIFHTDACQAPQYLPLDIEKLGISMLTLDASKIYGPKGIGLLFVKKGIKLYPIIFGGGQEYGLRSGTESVPQIIGFSKALSIVTEDRETESERIIKIKNYAISEIKKEFPNSRLNGSIENRIANNVNFCFPGNDSEFLVIKLGYMGIECAYASSCKTLGNDNASYVITSIGNADCASSSLRFTFGRFTKKEDIDFLIECLKKIIKK